MTNWFFSFSFHPVLRIPLEFPFADVSARLALPMPRFASSSVAFVPGNTRESPFAFISVM
jgi:hypothetical protein